MAIINEGRLVVEATVSELQGRYALPVFVLEFDDGRNAAIAPLMDEISTRPWATNVTSERDVVRVSASDPALAGPDLLRIVAESGLSLARFERARPSLEDIFLRLVTGSSAELDGSAR